MAGAPGQAGTAMTQQQAVQLNAALRSQLLASAPSMRKNLGTFNMNGVQAGTTRVKIFNVGIITRFTLDVTMKYDVVTAAVALGPKSPWNIIQRVKLNDFDSTDRVNASGFQLWVWNCVRRRMNYGYNNGAAAVVFASPVQPIAVGTNNIANFQIEIPVAFDPASDLRGALMAQTAVGEAYINIDWATTLVSTTTNADAVFVSATGTLANVTFSVNVCQEYLLPQAVGGNVPLPTYDLLTVYEFNGATRTSDNIAVGTEKLFNYPNVRSVIGAYFNYMNGGAMNPAPTDITKFRLIANGNNILQEYSANEKMFEQRIAMLDGSDTRPGVYFQLSRQKPVETALYGNFQFGITPLTVGAAATTNFEVAYESFYTKGSTLPGLAQSS